MHVYYVWIKDGGIPEGWLGSNSSVTPYITDAISFATYAQAVQAGEDSEFPFIVLEQKESTDE